MEERYTNTSAEKSVTRIETVPETVAEKATNGSAGTPVVRIENVPTEIIVHCSGT